MTLIDILKNELPEHIKTSVYPLPYFTMDISEASKFFEIYNNYRGEITGDAGIKRETSPHCSACVGRVMNRLKRYYDLNKNTNL